VNNGRHPHVPALLHGDFSTVSVGGTPDSNQESNDHVADRNKPVANAASSVPRRRSERLAKTKRVDLLTVSSEKSQFGLASMSFLNFQQVSIVKRSL